MQPDSRQRGKREQGWSRLRNGAERPGRCPWNPLARSRTHVKADALQGNGTHEQMSVLWLNGTIGSGKTAVGRKLAELLPRARFLDGDDCAGPQGLPDAERWRMAVDALFRAILRRGHTKTLVVAYPLDGTAYRRVRAACGKARRRLLVVNLAPPLRMTLQGRGGRTLTAQERARTRAMRSQGYHRRPFATVTLPNAQPPAVRTARKLACLFAVSGGPGLAEKAPAGTSAGVAA